MGEAIARNLRGLVAACALNCAASDARAGATPCWIDHGAVVAPAAFGDIAGDFIIDLSRSSSALHETRANMAGITAESARAPLSLAGERIADVSLAVVDLDTETRAFDTVINGVIGWDVLGRYAVELDLRNGRCRLSLTSPHHQVRRLAGPALSLVEVGAAPALAAAVSDGVSAREGLFRIDTAHEAVEVAQARLSRPKAGADQATPVRLRAVSVAGALVEQVPAEVMDPAVPGVDGSLGLSVWRGGVLRLDPAERRVTFRSPPGPQ
ncbi:MAG TPA: hypothetical protein VK801_16110 [Caulobacteraceae bacterium]|nr:hypothetical protein [Caulobacteraceae bacterium]